MKALFSNWLVPLAVLSISSGCTTLEQSKKIDSYGAVAYAHSTQDWRLRWKAADPQRVRQRVLADCAVADCQVVLEFGPGQCGALALNPQGGFGAGTGATSAAAEAAALDQCRSAGSGCRVVPAECNN